MPEISPSWLSMILRNTMVFYSIRESVFIFESVSKIRFSGEESESSTFGNPPPEVELRDSRKPKSF
jgi:hypothetical protein